MALSWSHAHVFLAKNRIQIRGPLGIFVTLDKTSKDSKVRRTRWAFCTGCGGPVVDWDGIWSQSKASSNKVSNTIPQHWTVFEASLKSASIRLQIRFPNSGTVLEASLKSASRRLQMRFSNLGRNLKKTRDF